jgi:hypothetical protein
MSFDDNLHLLLKIATWITSTVIVYFGCVGLGSLLELWIWHTCTANAFELHLIKPMYGSLVFFLALGVVGLWTYEKRRVDYTRLYYDINYQTA